MKKILLACVLIANAFATNLYAQKAEDIFKEVFDDGTDYEIDDVGHISAYAFYDVDGDGVVECFLKGEDDSYAMYCCGNNNGKPDKKSLKLVINSIYKTSLSIVPNKPFVNNAGGCGSGCYYTEFAKISKSQYDYHYICTSTFGPDDQEEHNCDMSRPVLGQDEPKTITKAQFDKAVPKNYTAISMDKLKWIQRKPVKKTIETVDATFHTQKGDTIILKDAKGYFYQITSPNQVGVASGGAYSGVVVIPSAIRYDGQTYTVKTVRREAMWKKPGANNIGTIISVVLPESVTLVGADAFRDNPSLSEVHYGDKTRIEVRSFWGCPKLRLENRPVIYSYTEPYVSEETNLDLFTKMYYPIDSADVTVTDYQWAIFKHQHNGVTFDKWMNMGKEQAMGCYCSTLDAVKAGVFRLNDPKQVSTMFKGNLYSDQIVLLAHNNYVATHEFLMFSRHNYDEEDTKMPQTFLQAMAKKYGRKVKYSLEAAKLLYTKPIEQLVVTEFQITNHEAMVVISWVKDGKEVCSYELKQKTDPEYEEYGVWNVDDDGTYGVPSVISITRDEKGNVELFLNHAAPESINLSRLVQQGNKFVKKESDQWYVWIDPQIDY